MRKEERKKGKWMDRKADVIIVGTGAAGLFAALSLPRDKEIIIITKRTQRAAIPFWLRAGSAFRDEADYESYFEDTMRAGHYENRKESVEIMIRSSREIIRELIGYGVDSLNAGQWDGKGADR